jgi:hypothetical protein
VQEELKKLAYNHEQSNNSVPLDDLKPSVRKPILKNGNKLTWWINVLL